MSKARMVVYSLEDEDGDGPWTIHIGFITQPRHGGGAGMKKWDVHLTATIKAETDVEVEAETEDAAIALAEKDWAPDPSESLDGWDVECDSISEID